MNTNVEIFKKEEFGTVRVILDENQEPLFCLADICDILELQRSAVSSRLDSDVISSHPIIDSMNREQRVNFVSEPGLYDVILGCRKPKAKPFKDWVIKEVLPTIRKTGHYSVKPMTIAQMFALQAQALLEIEQRQNEQDERIRRLEENQRENEAALKAIPFEDVTLPELPERQQINQLARLYAGSTGVNYREVWNKVYQELYYRYSISIRAHKKNLGETSYLDVAERIGCLDKIKNILNHLISKLELK
jgi:phage antirepressor protein